jgi:hypothetical protein
MKRAGNRSKDTVTLRFVVHGRMYFGYLPFLTGGLNMVGEYEPSLAASKYIPSRSGLFRASKEALPDHNNRRIPFSDVRFTASSRLSGR